MNFALHPEKTSGLHVNRVRLSVNRNECLLMLYHQAINVFYRYLFTEGAHGSTKHYKMVGSYDKETGNEQICYNSSPLQTACQGLQSLLSNSSNTIGTFELEFGQSDEKGQLELVQKIHGFIGNRLGFEKRITVEKLVVNGKIHQSVISSLKALVFNFKGKVYVDIENVCFESSEYEIPVVTIERLLDLTENGDTLRSVTYSTGYDIDHLTELALKTKGLATLRYSKVASLKLDLLPFPFEKVNEKVVMKRFVERGVVKRLCKSECGFWIHCVKQEDHNKYAKYFKSETCGIGHFCEKCTDSFNFEFYKWLYARLHYDQEWANAAWRPDNKFLAGKFDESMKPIAEKFKEEDNRKKQKTPKPEHKPENKKSLAHVRLSFSEKKCLFLTYQNKLEFTKQTFSESSEGVTVTHMDSSRKEKSFMLPKMTLLELVCRTVKTALKDCTIETFELEFSEKHQKKQENLVKDIQQHLKKAKGSENVFHAKTLVTNWIIHKDVVVLIREALFQTDKIQNVESIKLRISPDSLVPLAAYDTLHKVSKSGGLERTSMIFNSEQKGLKNLKDLASQSDGVTTLRLADNSTNWFDEQVVSVVRVNSKVGMKRFEDKTRKLVTRFNKSSCGMWIHCVKMENEEKFKEFFKNETCGLRDFCQKCSSRFDYWHHQNLPRRVYDQPDWCDLLWYPEEHASEHQNNLENLRNKFKEEMITQKMEQEKCRHWSGMRPEDKMEVVKRLDLMSRHALRSVSRADREVVDSTDFYVPRVRLSLKDDMAMLMVYTGIEKFLRVEIKRGNGGVMVYRMENTYNLRKASVKMIPSGVLPAAMTILQTLFIHKPVLIGTLEIEAVERNVTVQYLILGMILRCLRTHWFPENVFRAKRFVVNYVIGDRLRELMAKELLDRSVLEVLETEKLTIEGETPAVIQSYSKRNISKELGGVQTYNTEHTTADQEESLKKLLETNEIGSSEGYSTVSFDEFKKFTFAKGYEFEQERVKTVIVNSFRSTDTDPVIGVANYDLKCGGWVHLMRKSQEKRFKGVLKNADCALRHHCKQHADPFDRWFYNNLALRLYHEPNWFDILVYPGDYQKDKNPYEKLKKGKREVYKRLLKTRKRGVAKKTGVGESWGFTKMINKNVDSEISDYEN